MLETNKLQNAVRFGSQVSITANAATMPMGSMDMHKSMMSGMKSMESMKGSGDIDHDFAMMMKMHHQLALDMSNIQLQPGKDAKLRSMAKDTIKSQTRVIKAFDK